MRLDEHAPSDAAVVGDRVAPRANPARALLRNLGIRALGLSTFYVLVVVVFSLASEQFLSFSNALNIIANVTLIGIVSIGQAMAIISGGFDLSVGGTVPLSAV